MSRSTAYRNRFSFAFRITLALIVALGLSGGLYYESGYSSPESSLEPTSSVQTTITPDYPEAPASAFSVLGEVGSSFTSGTLQYLVTGLNTVSVKGFASGHETDSSVSIPATVSDGEQSYDVTSVHEGAFYDHSTLTKVDFSHAANLTTIEGASFARCGLDYPNWSPGNFLALPNSLKTIRAPQTAGVTEGAFEGNKGLRSVDFYSLSNLTVIGMRAFAHCNLNYLYSPLMFPSSLTGIGDSAFAYNVDLANETDAEDYYEGNKSIVLDLSTATSLTTIESDAFRAAGIRTAIRHDPPFPLPPFPTFSLFPLVFPQNLTTIGSGAFAENGALEAIDTTRAFSLKTIRPHAFFNCSLLFENTLPENRPQWKDEYDSPYRSHWRLVIPASVTSIGEYAFATDHNAYPGPRYRLGTNQVLGVTFLSKTPPFIGEHAFQTITANGRKESTLEAVLVLEENRPSYESDLAVAALHPLGISASDFKNVIHHRTMEFKKDTTAYRWGVGSEQAGIWTEIRTLEVLSGGQEALIDYPPRRVYHNLVTDPSRDIVGLAGTETNDLYQENDPSPYAQYELITAEAGTYYVVVAYVPTNSEDFAYQQTTLSAITLFTSPTVTGGNAVVWPVGSTEGTASVTASLQNAYAENIPATISLIGPPSASFDTALTGQAEQNLGIPGTELAQLPLGTYTITLTSQETTHNASIPATSLGTLTVSKRAVSAEGTNDITRQYATGGEQVVTARITGAYPEEMNLTCTATLGAVSLASTATATGDGTVTFTFPATAVESLDPGIYQLSVTALETEHNQAVSSTSIGTMTVDTCTPSVSGANVITCQYATGGSQVATVTVAGAYPENIPLTCTARLLGGASISTTATASGDGTVTFTFPATEVESLALGTYDLIVFAPATIYNKAIAPTAVGSMTIGKHKPSVSGANNPTRVVTDDAALSVTFDLENAYEESLGLAAVVRNASGDVVMRRDVTTDANGTLSATFSSTESSVLRTGSYQIAVFSDGSVHNDVIAPTPIGTVSVTPAHPTIPAGTSKSSAIGNVSVLQFSADLVGAYLEDSLEATAAIQGTPFEAEGRVDRQGKLTFVFDDSRLDYLALGTYTVTVSLADSENNLGFIDLPAGWLSIVEPTARFAEGRTTHTRGNTVPLVFIVETKYALAESCEVDLQVLTSDQAKISEGSTFVTLTPTYLDTLSLGTHTLSVHFRNGYTAKGLFFVAEKAPGPQPTPPTPQPSPRPAPPKTPPAQTSSPTSVFAAGLEASRATSASKEATSSPQATKQSDSTDTNAGAGTPSRSPNLKMSDAFLPLSVALLTILLIITLLALRNRGRGTR